MNVLGVVDSSFTVSPLANVSTTVTDIGLGIEALIFSYWLRRDRRESLRWWAIAFFAVGIAALSGSVYHGLYHQLAPAMANGFKRLTNVAISGASGAMVLGCLTRVCGGVVWRIGAAIVGLKFFLFCPLSFMHPDGFIYPVADYLSAMVMLVLLSGWAYGLERAAYAVWLLGGIGVSAIAAFVLAIKWTVHPLLSPDAIYHVIQMVALYFFFEGSRCLGDRHPVPD